MPISMPRVVFRTTTIHWQKSEVIEAIRALMTQPKPANRPIGFMADARA